MIQQFKAARRVSTPLIAVRTADPAATIATIAKSFNGTPMLRWNIVTGLAGMNTAGQQAVSNLNVDPTTTTNPVEALGLCGQLPGKALVFFENIHRVVGEQGVSQAVWNLRDEFKQNMRTLVLLAPDLTLPAEIAQDVLLLDEPLPTNDELVVIVKETYKAADLKPPADDVTVRAVDALCGLAAFPAEQVAAMSITRDGLDFDALWERKRKMIEATPGLSVWRGGETFDQIGGCENAKTFMGRILNGAEPPRAVVFLDEIEKQFAGTGTDLSGVSTEMTGTLLSWMQDNEAKGVIFIGPPGAAKSAIAKATGNTAGIPTIAFDLAGMKGSLVGESGARLRQSLKVVQAVSQGRSLFIATCNSIGVLPPELRRRFTFGTFFFDLPTAEERESIWRIYCKKFGRGDEVPNDEGWTGAEIRQCCDLAYRLKSSLQEAATYIVPVSRSAADQIDRLRQQANGRFISASNPGVYRYDKTAGVSTTARTISVED